LGVRDAVGVRAVSGARMGGSVLGVTGERALAR